MSNVLYLGDSRELLAKMDPCSVDAIVTDPPYEIGFMGRSWDSTGIAYDPEFWRLCLNVLKPGGHLVSFGACRTYHRIACAIEDAGFSIRESLHWNFGSGFPKSLDISKAIDKAAGAEREVVGVGMSGVNAGMQSLGESGIKGGAFDITAPATPEAQQWDGWGSALKPAHEPVVYACKPLTAVPFSATTNAVEAYLWSITPAKLAELLSASNLAGPSGRPLGSVRWLAAVCLGLRSEGLSALTDTFRSPEAAKTYLSIAVLWSDILAANLPSESTSIIETGTEETTGLRIWRSWISQTTPASITQASSSRNGIWRDATSAEVSSSGANWSVARQPSAPDVATYNTASEILSALVDIAARDSLLPQATAESIARRLAQIERPMSYAESDAHEPVVLARKPLAGTIAETVLEYGTGGLNVDGCRVAADDGKNRGRPPRTPNAILGGGAGTNLTASEHNETGRWPPNVLLSHETAAKLGDKASYFPVFDYGDEDRFFYAPKASREEREAGCEHLPGRTNAEAVDREPGSAGANNPRAGAGRENGKGAGVKVRNFHPT